MHNAFAKSLPVWTQCSIDGFSFYFDLVNTEWRDTTIPNSPLHRVCTLMRKLEVAAFVREDAKVWQQLARDTGAKVD